jgi:hypothetical protein
VTPSSAGAPVAVGLRRRHGDQLRAHHWARWLVAMVCSRG